MDGARAGKEPNFPLVTFQKMLLCWLFFSNAYPRKENRSNPREAFWERVLISNSTLPATESSSRKFDGWKDDCISIWGQ